MGTDEGAALFGTAVSGGCLEDYLKALKATCGERLLVVPERLAMRFSLPCPTGVGTKLTPQELERAMDGAVTFFSPELGCRYFREGDAQTAAVVLYDTDETMDYKRRFLKELGIREADEAGNPV